MSLHQKHLLAALFVIGIAILVVGAVWLPRLWQGNDAAEALASADVSQDAREEAPADPAIPLPLLPSADDSRVSFEDAADAIERGGLPYRTFEIAAPGDQKDYLMATYTDNPEWANAKEDDELLITWLMDLNAGFTASASYDLPPVGQWQRVRISIGDFAQDYCGDLSVVYSFRDARIFAAASAPPFDFSVTGCPLSRSEFEQTWAEHHAGSKPPEFCQVRATCIKAFFDDPDHRALLPTDTVASLGALQLH